jgi:hypothetical protein
MLIAMPIQARHDLTPGSSLLPNGFEVECGDEFHRKHRYWSRFS